MAVASVALGTAIEVAMDMTGGIIARFRTMDIAKVSVLTGHVLGAVVKTVLAVARDAAFAVLLGYRSDAGLADWLGAFGAAGPDGVRADLAHRRDGAGRRQRRDGEQHPAVPVMLPFLSSGFVPTDAMPAGLRHFAEHQPFTPMIDSLRA